MVVADRTAAGLAAGASGAIVLHGESLPSGTTTSPGIGPLSDTGAIAVDATGTMRPLVTPSGEHGYHRDPQQLRLFDADGEAALLDCERLDENDARCIVRAPWSPALDGLSFAPPSAVFAALSGYAAGGRDGRVFVAALPSGDMPSGWVWVLTAGGTAHAPIDLRFDGVEGLVDACALYGFCGFSMRPTDDGTARLVWRDYTLTIDANGSVVEAWHRAPVPTAGGGVFDTLVRTEAWRSAHGESAPFNRVVTAAGPRWLGIWADGGDGSTLHAGWVDPSALATPAIEVTRRGGWSMDIASLGDSSAAITWESVTEAGVSEVRLATLRCVPP